MADPNDEVDLGMADLEENIILYERMLDEIDEDDPLHHLLARLVAALKGCRSYLRGSEPGRVPTLH